jgi:hypothetical protein
VTGVKADLIVVVAGSGAGDVGPVSGQRGSASGQDNDATDAEAQGAGPARRPAASPTLSTKPVVFGVRLQKQLISDLNCFFRRDKAPN